MKPNLEAALRARLAALTPAALEALASKGLLRRAAKDLDQGVLVRVAGESERGLLIRVAEHEVTLPDSGPALARCTCPATGACQHILAACLFLQRSHPTEASPPASVPTRSDLAPDVAPSQPQAESRPISARAELLAFTREDLEAWAGRAEFRAALKLAVARAAEITDGLGVAVRFPALNARCHYLPGSGLDGLIVPKSSQAPRALAVAAVIAFQRANGVPWELASEPAAALAEAPEAPRSRAEVLESAQRLLIETVAAGLVHLSAATQQRFATLAVSCLGVNLPRLSLALRALADEVAASLARDARTDLGRLFLALARAYALRAALAHAGASARADLIGWHRTQYTEVGHLDLAGVAAWPWQTESGYAGLTVLFWDLGSRRWNSWSEARPGHAAPAFQPAERFQQDGPWQGAESPEQLAHSRFRLLNARRNPAGRLSASAQSRVLVSGATRAEDIGAAVAGDWHALQAQLARATAIGLAEANPLDSLVVVQPAALGQRAYDEVNQTLRWPLLDEAGNELLLAAKFDQFTAPAIEALESLPPASLAGCRWLGRARQVADRLQLYPYALLRPAGEIVNFGFARNQPATGKGRLPPAEQERETALDEEETAEPVPAGGVLGRLLAECEEALLVLAESGVVAPFPSRLEQLSVLAARAETLGLQVLANSLRLAAAPATASPAALLQSRYHCWLHWQAAPSLTVRPSPV